MKVWIEKAHQSPSDLGGKSLFCNRLAHELARMGVFVTNKDEDVDISLNVIRIKHYKAKVKVLRLDGVWHDVGKDWKGKNKSIKRSLNEADGVIYQSKFSNRMADMYLGVPKCPTCVIRNGSLPKFYEGVQSLRGFENQHVILAFSQWRPHKRLVDIVESFLLAKIPNGRLLIAGDLHRSGLLPKQHEFYWSHPQVSYLGILDQSGLASCLKIAKAVVHLCWFDSCPNSVVESLCAGVPVICNNVGGTPALIEIGGGIVCKIDEPYNMKPVDLYHPPKIDRDVVAKAMIYCINHKVSVYPNTMSIEVVAKQYFNFFRSLLCAI